jgi:branched-chain amino acid transport system permease protein
MNFAFGTFYMLAAFTVTFLMVQWSLPFAAAIIGTVVVATTIGWLFGRSVVLPAMRISPASVMIATLGMGVAMTNLAQAAFGADVSYIASPLMNVTYRLGSAALSLQAVICVLMAPLIALGLTVFMNRTVLGQRIQATAEFPELASATGFNVPAIQVLAVVIGIVLAAVAAILYAPVGVIFVLMGDEILLKAFAITALAGVGRIGGALIVAFLIGIFEAWVGAFISTAYSTAAIYGLLIVALTFFPRGLFRGH